MIRSFLWRGNINVTTHTDPAGVCRHTTTGVDRKMLLQVPRMQFQLCSDVHSCHTSHANMRNREADSCCALAHALVSVGGLSLIFF